jgi:hypothetical protein
MFGVQLENNSSSLDTALGNSGGVRTLFQTAVDVVVPYALADNIYQSQTQGYRRARIFRWTKLYEDYERNRRPFKKSEDVCFSHY